MKIKDLMAVDVEAVEQGATLDEAAYIMGSAGVRSLPVVKGETVVGIITDRDIIGRAVAEGLDCVETKVHDVMTGTVVTCRAEDDLTEAQRLLARHGFRQIVIVDGEGQLAGMLDRADIANAAAHEPSQAV
jgi:CBS domain-containing protein